MLCVISKSSLKKFAITLSMKAMHFMNTSSCLIGTVKRFIYMTLTIRQIHEFTNGIDILSLKVLIPSGGHILVTRTDPDIFRYLNDIPPSRAIYNPYECVG